MNPTTPVIAGVPVIPVFTLLPPMVAVPRIQAKRARGDPAGRDIRGCKVPVLTCSQRQPK